jgi:hypothetical protein
MTALAGLPDFGNAISSGATVAYATFGSGPYLVMPGVGALTAFRLTMTKVAGNPGAAGGYAMLDLEVGCSYPLEQALALARATTAGATVARLPIDLGYARLVSAGTVIALPDAVTRPVMLGWSKEDGARWSQRLDLDVAEVIKGAVQKGAMLFGVFIEFCVKGVATRANGSVSFAPAPLMAQLLGTGKSTISREDLITRLSDSSRSPALSTAASRIDIAEAVADRLLAAFGQFMPAAGTQDFPGFAIPGPLSSERLDWDLSVPAAGARAYALKLDTLTGLAQLDPGSLVEEIVIPPLDLGFREVRLAANLPARRIGAPAIGVRLSAPPAPPNRPNGINQSVTLSPPDDMARVTLRFDPDESFTYELTPFAVVAASGMVHEFDAPSTPSSASFLQLQAADFQLAFTHITASDRLVAAATLAGSLAFSYGGHAATVPFRLAPGASDIAIAMPFGASDASLSLTATAADGTVLNLPPMAAGRIALDFASFAQYGPQRVPVHGDFSAGDPPLTVDFEPENGVGAASIALAPSDPDMAWTYFAANPFSARYRFRPQGGAWSPLLVPGEPLNLNAQGIRQDMSTPSGPPPQPKPAAPFTVDGVQVAPDRSGLPILRYVPATPTPELGPSGKPTLMLLKTSNTASLQLGVHFDLPAGGDAVLARAIALHDPALAAMPLQPAAVQIRHIAVTLADENGVAHEIAAATGSAFPPYAAVFAIALDAGQAAQAISAVNGRTGVLAVAYTIVEPGADAPVIKTTDVGSWFPGGSGSDHLRIVPGI